MEKTLKIISLDKVRSLDPSLPIYILSPIFTTSVDVKYCLKILSQHLDIVNQFLTLYGNLYLIVLSPLILAVEEDRIKKREESIGATRAVKYEVDVSEPVLDLASLNYVTFRLIDLELYSYSRELKCESDINALVNLFLKHLDKIITIFVDDAEKKYHIIPTDSLGVQSFTATFRPIVKVKNEDELNDSKILNLLKREVKILLRSVLALLRRRWGLPHDDFTMEVVVWDPELACFVKKCRDCEVEVSDNVYIRAKDSKYIIPLIPDSNPRPLTSTFLLKYLQIIAPLSYKLIWNLYRGKICQKFIIYRKDSLQPIATFDFARKMFRPVEPNVKLVQDLADRLSRHGINVRPFVSGSGLYVKELKSPIFIVTRNEIGIDEEDVYNILKLLNVDARFMIYYTYLKSVEVVYSRHSVKYISFRGA